MGGILKRMPIATIITKIYNSNDKKYDEDMNKFKATVEAVIALLNASIDKYRINSTKANKMVLVALMSSAEQVERSVEIAIHNVDDSKIAAKQKIVEDITKKWFELKEAIGKANELLKDDSRNAIGKANTPPEFDLSNREPADRESISPADLGYSDFCTRLANLNFTYKNLRSYPKKFDVETLKEETRVLRNEIGEVIKKLDEGKYDETDPDVYNTFINLEHEVKLIYDDVTKITPVRF